MRRSSSKQSGSVEALETDTERPMDRAMQMLRDPNLDMEERFGKLAGAAMIDKVFEVYQDRHT